MMGKLKKGEAIVSIGLRSMSSEWSKYFDLRKCICDTERVRGCAWEYAK